MLFALVGWFDWEKFRSGQVTGLCFGGLRSDGYVSFCEHGGARDVRGGICVARSKRAWEAMGGAFWGLDYDFVRSCRGAAVPRIGSYMSVVSQWVDGARGLIL